MILSPSFERLVTAFNRFPGIGKKSAQRLAWHLISEDKSFARELANIITETTELFCMCDWCNMLSETNPCPICSSSDRNDDQLCVVESSADVIIIENMNEYNGKYFVLGHLLSPIDGFGPEQIHIAKLLANIATSRPKELILALKPSAEGEATIHYLSEVMADKALSITRLSTGIPFGGDLEYSSLHTLSNAWKRRYTV